MKFIIIFFSLIIVLSLMAFVGWAFEPIFDALQLVKGVF